MIGNATPANAPLLRIEEHCQALEAFQRAAPTAQPDAE